VFKQREKLKPTWKSATPDIRKDSKTNKRLCLSKSLIITVRLSEFTSAGTEFHCFKIFYKCYDFVQNITDQFKYSKVKIQFTLEQAMKTQRGRNLRPILILSSYLHFDLRIGLLPSDFSIKNEALIYRKNMD
jgi:hypothetical protein